MFDVEPGHVDLVVQVRAVVPGMVAHAPQLSPAVARLWLVGEGLLDVVVQIVVFIQHFVQGQVGVDHLGII